MLKEGYCSNLLFYVSTRKARGINQMFVSHKLQ